MSACRVYIALLSMLLLCGAQAKPLPWFEWDYNIEVDQEQGISVREAAFGSVSNSSRCDYGSLPMARLLFPPVTGSFTQAGADETLYIYWFCEDAADAFVINRKLVIAADGELVAVVAHQPMRYGGIAVTAVAAVDLDGDGLMELVEVHSAAEYSAAHVFSISNMETNLLFNVVTSMDSCGLVRSGSWTTELNYAAASQPGVLSVITSTRTYHPCSAIHQVEDWWMETQYRELALSRVQDPSAYALRLLALARHGYVDAQLDMAEMYRHGDILPKSSSMADWWQERADASR